MSLKQTHTKYCCTTKKQTKLDKNKTNIHLKLKKPVKRVLYNSQIYINKNKSPNFFYIFVTVEVRFVNEKILRKKEGLYLLST